MDIPFRGIVRGRWEVSNYDVNERIPAATQMMRVGEETGTLDAQMDAAADFFAKELDYKLARLTALAEPAVIIVMGVIVGFVAIALVSAMYGIFQGSSTLKG